MIRHYLMTTDRTRVERVAVAFLPELAAPAAPVAAASVTAIANGAALAMPDLWHHLTILPGLEIHLHSTASPGVKALARAVLDQIRRGAVA